MTQTKPDLRELLARFVRNLRAIADGKPEQFDLIAWSSQVSSADRIRYVAKELEALAALTELSSAQKAPLSAPADMVTDEMVEAAASILICHGEFTTLGAAENRHCAKIAARAALQAALTGKVRG